jgi:putative glutamine amidotransferase
MRIAMTDPMTNPVKHAAYLEYLGRWLPDVEIEVVSYKAVAEANRFDGVVLTGGVDVDPAFYAREDARSLVEEPDFRRDRFEVDFIRGAMGHDLPIFGICRGMQICNVALGGSLIPDLETAGYRRHTTRREEPQRIHGISVDPTSLLHSVSGRQAGTVSTYHHQAVDVVAPGLKVTARSEDGVVEALEWDVAAGHPFLLLVQWHPERMTPVDDPFAKNLLEAFLGAMQQRRKAVHQVAAPLKGTS